MRKLLFPLLWTAVSCAFIAPPRPTGTAPAVIPPPPFQGLTIEEEARILALEDRREYDPAVVLEWSRNPNPVHRARMALALGRIGPQTFIDTTADSERGPGEQQAGVTELTAMAKDPDASVRTTVAFSLGEIGDPHGIGPLFDLAEDSNATVAAEACEALSKIGKDVPLGRYDTLTVTGAEGSRGRAVRFLFRFNSDEASAIATAALDGSATIRQEAAYALSRRAYAPAREKLQLLVNDANVLTRAYAVAALGRIGAAESMPVLVHALGDIHPWVRTNALVAVGRLAAKNAAALSAAEVPRMLALTEDPDVGTRASAVDTLGWYAAFNPTARGRLFEIATNGSRWERELAAGAIARNLGDEDLSLIPSDLSPWAKVRVLEAAAQLKKNGDDLRRRFAADEDVLVRENVISTIPDAAVDTHLDLIRAALDHADPIVRANAIERYSAVKAEPDDARVPTLIAAEQRARTDHLDDARVAAVTALGGIDYPERESFLRSLLADADFVVRRVAADLIEQKLNKPRPQYTPLPVGRSATEYEQIVAWSRQPHTATIHLTRGDIGLALLSQEAPITAWNFAQLAQKKYFDNTSFMRVVPNFVIQGGDPRDDQNGGPGYAIRDEINLQKYTRGALGMALSGPDTGGSQFFITHSPQPHLDGGYTIFGRVYSGITAVVDATERGDRVETITIDDQTPASAAQLRGVEALPAARPNDHIVAEGRP